MTDTKSVTPLTNRLLQISGKIGRELVCEQTLAALVAEQLATLQADYDALITVHEETRKQLEAAQGDAKRWQHILPSLEAHQEFSDEESRFVGAAWIQLKREGIDVPFPWHGDDASVCGRIDAAIVAQAGKDGAAALQAEQKGVAR